LVAARRHLITALEQALALTAYIPAAYTLPFVAHFLVATDHVKRGAATWELALKHPFVANSAWFAGMVGK
jgi:hypothetical protein